MVPRVLAILIFVMFGSKKFEEKYEKKKIERQNGRKEKIKKNKK